MDLSNIKQKPTTTTKNQKEQEGNENEEGAGTREQTSSRSSSPTCLVARRQTARRTSRRTPYTSGEGSTFTKTKEPVVKVKRLEVKSIEEANFQLSLFRPPAMIGTAENPLPSTSGRGRSPSPACASGSETGSVALDEVSMRTQGVNRTRLEKGKARCQDDEAIEIDSIDGEESREPVEEDRVSVTSSVAEDMVAEQMQEKRGRGRPPSTGEHVGKRLKEEEAALRKREEERTKRAAESLKPVPPKTARWKRLLEQEEEVEDALRQEPTEAIAAQLLEHSTILFKVADCSNGMKGELVKQVKDSVALLRAATSVMTSRIRTGENPDLKEIREELRKLREENEELKREMERIKSAPPPPQTASQSSSARDTSEKRKRRRIIVSDEETDTESSPRIEKRDPKGESLSPPQDMGEGAGLIDLGEKEFPPLKRGPVRQVGPPIKGKSRPLEAFPPDLPEEAKAQFNSLMDRKDAVLALLDPIVEQMEALRFSKRASAPSKTAPVPPTAHPVTGREAQASNPQGERGRGKEKVKKGKKTDGGQGPSGSKPSTTSARGKGAPSPAARKGQLDLDTRRAKPPTAVGKERPTSAKAKRGLSIAQSTPLPLPSAGEKEAWTEVIGRKARRQAAQGPRERTDRPAVKTGESVSRKAAARTGPSPSEKKKKKKGKRRTPKTAAVVITCPPGEYKEVLREAVEKIDLASMNIGGMAARKAVTGAQIYEIAGPEKERKADALASKLREVVGQREGVRISRPAIMAEVRIRGLDESVVPADVIRAVAAKGECSPEDVKSGEIQFVGRGPGTAWVRCPVAAANRIVAAGAVQVGWIKARVEALEKRALQCFRCLKKGHTIAQCTGPDRSNLCYRCGRSGHLARECRAPEHCPVCADMGRPAGHRAGSKPCASAKEGRKKGGNQPSSSQARNPPTRKDNGPEERSASSLPAVTGEGEETPKPQRQRRERGPSKKSPVVESGITGTEEMEVDLEESQDHK